MEKTIKIHRWDNGNVIFLYTCENNTIRKTVEEAIKRGISLSYANLQYADLTCLNLSKTNLSYTNLFYANLACTVLSDVNLSNANLRCASFVCSHLNKVNFNGANLKTANFTYSVLTDVTFDNAVGINDQCPKEGSFIGWKKCKFINRNYPYIVKLEIPADAKRSSSTGKKCRCSKAKVLEIQNIDGTITEVDHVSSISRSYDGVYYQMGEIVEPDSFDEEFWNECSHGIHFFMNREDAVNW